MLQFFKPTLFIAAAGVWFATPQTTLAATVLLDVDGPIGGNILVGDSSIYAATAASFTTKGQVNDATLGMEIYCTRACSGEIRLAAFTIDPSIANPNVPVRATKAVKTFERDSRGDLDLRKIIDGLTLEANTTYSLMMEVLTGNATWTATSAPTYDETYVSVGPNYVTRGGRFNNPFSYPFSAFDQTAGQNPLRYEISGTVAQGPVAPPVPLPASSWLMLAALAALTRLRRS